MLVWYHTASPPQHVASVSKVELTRDGIPNWVDDLLARRGVFAEFYGVFEDNRGVCTLQIFDTLKRANAWRRRNPDMSYII